MLRVNPVTINIIPKIPATPNPGIANISIPIRITPTTKIRIS